MIAKKEDAIEYVCSSCGFSHTRALPKCIGCGVETDFVEVMVEGRRCEPRETEENWQWSHPVNWCALGLIVFFFVP